MSPTRAEQQPQPQQQPQQNSQPNNNNNNSHAQSPTNIEDNNTATNGSLLPQEANIESVKQVSEFGMCFLSIE